MEGTLTAIGSKVTKNFDTFGEAQAFQDGIKVLSGMLGKHTAVTIGNILPLDGKGYTTSVIIDREFGEGLAE